MLLSILALVLSGNSVAANSDAVAAVDSIFEQWSSPETPGCAVGVVDDGQLVLSRAYGMANLEQGVPNHTSTLFEVGSISKQFVATSILMLAEEGKLRLADNIREYIPEMPEYGYPITVNHLLTHTSGIRDWGFLAELAGWERTTRVLTNSDALAIIARQRHLIFRPGDEYRYTNSGYVLLAIIVERVSGRSLQEYTDEKIFKPLGMKSTRWRDDFQRVVKGRSTAYMNVPDRGYVRTMPHENVYGDAGVLTTTGDMLIWNAALSDHRFGDYVASELVRPTVLSNGRHSIYGRGLRVSAHNGLREISHGGGIGAYRAWLARFPEHKLSIAVACNAGDPDYTYSGEYFGERVATLFLPTPEAAENSPYPTRARIRAGLFVSDLTGMPLRLLSNGNQLSYDEKLGGEGKQLRAMSTERMALGEGTQLVFENSDQFRLETEYGNVEAFRRVDPVRLDEVELEDFVGRFYSDEIKTTYLITKEAGGLVLHIEDHPSVFHLLKPVYRDAFMYETRFGPNTVLVRFYRDASGAVNELSVGWRNQRVRDLRFGQVQHKHE